MNPSNLKVFCWFCGWLETPQVILRCCPHLMDAATVPIGQETNLSLAVDTAIEGFTHVLLYLRHGAVTCHFAIPYDLDVSPATNFVGSTSECRQRVRERESERERE